MLSTVPGTWKLLQLLWKWVIVEISTVMVAPMKSIKFMPFVSRWFSYSRYIQEHFRPGLEKHIKGSRFFLNTQDLHLSLSGILQEY